MLASKGYMEHHNQVPGITYKNNCTKFGLETLMSKWVSSLNVVENGQAKILWDFQTSTDNQVMANQLDIVVVVNKMDKMVVVTVPKDREIPQSQRAATEEEGSGSWH